MPGKALEIFPDIGARLLAPDAELVGEAEGRDAVDDAEIDRLRAAPDFARHALDRHAEHFRSGHGVNVELIGEGLLQRRDVGDVSEKAQFDLAIVGRDELAPLRRDEGAADLAPRFGADGDVLQIGLRRRQPPGGRRGEGVGRMHASRRRVDKARQGVGVGRLEFRQLPPFEHPPRQGVTFRREVFEDARGGRPGAGRRFLAARQAHLAKKDVAELLWRAEIERRADELRHLVLEPRHTCANSPERRDRISRSMATPRRSMRASG